MENPKTIVDIFQQIILLKQLKGFFRRFVPSFFRNSKTKAFHILYQYFFIHLHKSSFRYIDRLNSSCRFWPFSIGQTLMWIQAHHVLSLSFGSISLLFLLHDLRVSKYISSRFDFVFFVWLDSAHPKRSNYQKSRF